MRDELTAAEATELVDKAIYLFCLTTPGGRQSEQTEGLEPGSAMCELVTSDIKALLCTVDADPWRGEAGERNLSDLNWLGPRAVRHEAVIRANMGAGPVLPVRFGTMFASVDRLRAFVDAHAKPIRAFLDSMVGQEEWGVKGFLDRAAAAKAVGDRTSASTPCSSSGAGYLQRRKLAAQAMEQLTHEIPKWGEDIDGRLRTLSARVCRLRIGGAKDERGDTVFNWAVLVPGAKRQDLATLVTELNTQWGELGLTLACTGPWPPYGFCPSLGGERSAEDDDVASDQAGGTEQNDTE